MMDTNARESKETLRNKDLNLMYVHRHFREIKIRKQGFNPQRMYIGIPMLPYFLRGLGLYTHDNTIKFSLAQELLELKAGLRISMATKIYEQLRDLKEKI